MTRLSISEPTRVFEFLDRLRWEHGIELKQVVFIPSKDETDRFERIGIAHDIKSNSVLKAKQERVAFLIGFDLVERFKHEHVLLLEKNTLYSLYQARLPLFSWEIWDTDVLNVFITWLVGNEELFQTTYINNKRIKEFVLKGKITVEEILKKMSLVNMISALSSSVRNQNKVTTVFVVDESIDLSKEEMVLEERDSALVIMLGEREKALLIADKIKLPLIQVSKKKFYFILAKLMSRKIAKLFPGLIIKEIVV